MGKLGALVFGAVVGLAYLDKKREDSRRRADYEDPNNENEDKNCEKEDSNSEDENPNNKNEDLNSEDEDPDSENEDSDNTSSFAHPKYAPTPISSAERERQRLKQDGVNLANAKVYNRLTLRQGENSIRVLRIQPNANLYADLSCNLEVVSMDSKYIALSYTWGSVYNRANISIVGQVFSATRDLEIALRHLRANSAERVIWIDAICINQGDKGEVSWHMDCMRDVYAKAEATMIWIGEGNSRSDFTIEHFNNAELDGLKALLADYKKSEKAWRGLEELVDRPWWSRLWIVQEAIVSKLPLLVCGQRFWKFDDFTRLIGFVFANKLDNLVFSPVVRNSPFTRTVVLLEAFRKSWAEKSGNWGFHLEYYIMVFGLKHNCLHPSDKVRGLLGLANDRDRRDIERAGYSSDESPSVIYRKITAYIVTHRYHNSELDFLCQGRGPRRGKNFPEGTPPLPTWAPDLSVPPWESFPTLTRNAWESDDNFCASTSKSGSSTIYSREFENDGGISVWPSGLVLTVRGIVVDTVKDVGHVYDLDIDSIDFSSGTSRLTLAQKTHHKAILDQAIDLTRRASRRNEGRYPRQRAKPIHRCEIFSPCVDYYHAASQTLTCGRDPSENGKPYKTPLDGGLFKNPCRSFRPQNTEFETEILLQNVLTEDSLNRHFRRLRRSFMVSETGYLGIVPPETRAADRICVLYGCSVPVILRSSDDWPIFFFIGECYVHGIMYGEALDDVIAGKLSEREFDLL